jgi:hypothetical protein
MEYLWSGFSVRPIAGESYRSNNRSQKLNTFDMKVSGDHI